jgi:hypothetical protein
MYEHPLEGKYMTDDLVAILEGRPPKDKRTRCYTNEWLESLDPELRASFLKALDQSSKWKTANLYELAQTRGYEKQYNAFRTHRAGTCSCG